MGESEAGHKLLMLLEECLVYVLLLLVLCVVTLKLVSVTWLYRKDTVKAE